MNISHKCPLTPGWVIFSSYLETFLHDSCLEILPQIRNILCLIRIISAAPTSSASDFERRMSENGRKIHQQDIFWYIVLLGNDEKYNFIWRDNKRGVWAEMGTGYRGILILTATSNQGWDRISIIELWRTVPRFSESTSVQIASRVESLPGNVRRN